MGQIKDTDSAGREYGIYKVSDTISRPASEATKRKKQDRKSSGLSYPKSNPRRDP
jgi:hypothetical protein